MRRSRPAPRRHPLARVRWDRIGRTALLIVLIVVAGLIVQHTIEYFMVRGTASTQRALVTGLARQNAALRAQKASLQQPDTVRRMARELGMVQSGERPYVILGLPAH